MRFYIVVLVIATCSNSLAQHAIFPNAHIRLLKTLDKHLSNNWKCNVSVDPYDTILFVHLFTPLTENNRGNVGVSIDFLKKRPDAKAEDKSIDSEEEGYEFFETQSYYGYVKYCLKNCRFVDCIECEEKYVTLTPLLVTELKQFLNKHYNDL